MPAILRFPKRQQWHCPDLGGDSSNPPENTLVEPTADKPANLWSSRTEDGQHMPCIDLDLPARLVPSETPGHSHLFIDYPISWDAYKKILVALAEAGIVQDGWVNAALERGFTTIATGPWKAAKK